MEANNNTQIAKVQDEELLMHLNNLGIAKDLTDGEKNTYLQVAKAFNLNPFKREIHVSKYNGQMTLITGYEVYIKRAERTGLLDGWSVTTEGKVDDNTLKAIITIYRKDRKFPFVHEVYYSEYVQKTNSGSVTKFWQKAITMIKKVAMSQGFRLCFSDELGGMPYTNEEMPEQEAPKVEEATNYTVENITGNTSMAAEPHTNENKNPWQQYMEMIEKSNLPADERNLLLKDKKGVSYLDWNNEAITRAIELFKEKYHGQTA